MCDLVGWFSLEPVDPISGGSGSEAEEKGFLLIMLIVASVQLYDWGYANTTIITIL